MTALQEVKHQLYRLCQDYLKKRIETAQQAIAEAQQSASEETKSSAGDKYETGRAMMQLEIEKNGRQLAESLKVKQTLDGIQIDRTYASIQPGCLVLTSEGMVFMAISLGKVILDGQTFLVIAPSSPLGAKLTGAKAGDAVRFKDQTYLVRELI